MSKQQKQIIFIELVIVFIVIWKYFDNSLTYKSVFVYTALYVVCMLSWFYFEKVGNK